MTEKKEKNVEKRTIRINVPSSYAFTTIPYDPEDPGSFIFIKEIEVRFYKYPPNYPEVSLSFTNGEEGIFIYLVPSTARLLLRALKEVLEK